MHAFPSRTHLRNPSSPFPARITSARLVDRSSKTSCGFSLMEEGRAIMDSYGNSPAFCMFTLGNELSGERPAMAAIVSALRAYDRRHAYAIGTNAFFGQPKQQEGDDFWVTMRTRVGEAGRTRASYSHADLPLGR